MKSKNLILFTSRSKKITWNWLEHYTTIFLLFFRSSWNGGQRGQTCKRRGVNCSNNSRPPLPQEYYFSVTRSIVLYFFEIPARLWHCVQLASSISRITCVRNRLWVSLALKMWFLLLALKDRTHEERVSEFCTPDDEERKMKTRLKFDEFFSRLKLLILYPKWAILCASSSFLPLFFEITMLVLKILLVLLPTWWWQIHGKNNFFWNFYLMNYWTYTLTDLQNLHGMIAQDCFEDAGTTHTTTFLQKKSIESFLFACCILWFSDQLICCLVFPADLGYIVTAAICFHLPCVLRLRSRSSNSPLLIDLWKQLSF